MEASADRKHGSSRTFCDHCLTFVELLPSTTKVPFRSENHFPLKMCLHLSLVLRWRPPLLLRQPANTSLKQTRQMSLNTIGDVSLRSRGHGEVTPSSASRPRHTSDERQGSLFSSSTRTSESPPPPVPHTHTLMMCVWHRNPTVIAYVCTLEHQVCPTMFVLRSTADTSHTWMVTPV